MDLNRRGLLGALLAAPLILRAPSMGKIIMPTKPRLDARILEFDGLLRKGGWDYCKIDFPILTRRYDYQKYADEVMDSFFVIKTRRLPVVSPA